MKVSTVLLFLAVCRFALPLPARADLPAQNKKLAVTVGSLDQICTQFVKTFARKDVPVTYLNSEGRPISAKLTLVGSPNCFANSDSFNMEVVSPTEWHPAGWSAFPRSEIRFHFWFKSHGPATMAYQLVANSSDCESVFSESTRNSKDLWFSPHVFQRLNENARTQICPTYSAAALTAAFETINSFK